MKNANNYDNAAINDATSDSFDHAADEYEEHQQALAAEYASQQKQDDETGMTVDEVADFKAKLYAGEVKFQFIKKDGTLRKARGTMRKDLLPPPPPDKEYSGEKLKKANKPTNIITYYDLDSKNFRSFDSTRFEGIID